MVKMVMGKKKKIETESPALGHTGGPGMGGRTLELRGRAAPAACSGQLWPSRSPGGHRGLRLLLVLLEAPPLLEVPRPPPGTPPAPSPSLLQAHPRLSIFFLFFPWYLLILGISAYSCRCA